MGRRVATLPFFAESAFSLRRRIKTWSMETCAPKTSFWPVRGLTVSAAPSSSSATLASPSLCSPDKVRSPAPPASRSRPAGEGTGLGFCLLLESILLQKVSAAPVQPLGAEEMPCGGGLVFNLKELTVQKKKQLGQGTSGPCDEGACLRCWGSTLLRGRL